MQINIPSTLIGMAEYDRAYMLEHCIDVYFRYRDRHFHVLTYGTIIPTALNNVEKNRSLQHHVAIDSEGTKSRGEILIEQDYVNEIKDASMQVSGGLGNEQLVPKEETIVQMFRPNAELGFYSYDCIKELEEGKGLYRLVAYPGEGIDIREYETMPEYTGIEIVEEDEQRGVIIKFKM